MQQAITVAAPLEDVYKFWANYSNLARFMSHVKEVRDLGGGRSHWVVDGPAGTTVEWDAQLDYDTPYRELKWSSLPDSQVGNCGSVRFEPDPRGGTRVHVHISYTPPAGELGAAFSSLLGANPRQMLDEDLRRFKALIEADHTSGGPSSPARPEAEQLM
jgi:uncharacterized membrane protein